MRTIKAVLLDMDGTIIDSNLLHIKAAMEAYKQAGYSILANQKEFLKRIGKPFEEITKELANKKRIKIKKEDIEFLKYLKNYYFIKYINNLKLIEGVSDFLRFLKKKKIKIALVSSSNKYIILYILSHFKIYNYFDTIISAEDIRLGKPYPEPYLRALSILDINPKEALVIEDSIFGIISARRAKIPVIHINTYKIKKNIKYFKNIPSFSNFIQIKEFLEKKLNAENRISI